MSTRRTVPHTKPAPILQIGVALALSMSACSLHPEPLSPPLPSPSGANKTEEPAINATSLDISLSSLPPGDYIVVSAPDDHSTPTRANRYSLFAATTDGIVAGRLLTNAWMDAAFSPEGNRVAFWHWEDGSSMASLFTIELPEGEPVRVPGFYEEAIPFHPWSPTAGQVAVSINGVLKLVDLHSGEASTMLDCPTVFAGGLCYALSWSPDGRWIIFGVDMGPLGPSDTRDGTYAMNSDCLRDVTSCLAALHGPVHGASGTSAWSPDSRWLALPREGNITLLSSTTWLEADEIQIPGGAKISSMAWSPDGQSIAFTSGDTLAIATVADGSVKLLPPTHAPAVYVVSWLRSPQ